MNVSELPNRPTFEDVHAAMSSGLLDHSAEVTASHQGQPTIAEQNRTHGAGAPTPDRG